MSISAGEQSAAPPSIDLVRGRVDSIEPSHDTRRSHSRTNNEGADVLAERIRTNVEKHSFQYQEHIIPVTVSVGVAVAEAETVADYEQMKHVAAAALADAKANGRNRSVVRTVGPRPFEQAG